MNLTYQPATKLAAWIRDGETSSTEVVGAHLDQIKHHNDDLNAVVILKEDEALETARERDQEAERGELRGPLHGVPMTVKEQYWLEAEKATINNEMFADWTAPEDAVVVDRLKQAGAVIMGKTNIPKDLLDYQVWGDIYPDGKNPYDPERSPGGSSGGSAAALASGMTPIELGGDFGGSIRNPSHFCGVYGMKPTENTVPDHGLVPVPENAKGHVFHMASAGPMARTVDDMRLVWEIIRGPHPTNRTTPRIGWGDESDRQLSDFRVAWVDRWPDFEPSNETRSLIGEFAEELSESGCEVANVSPPDGLHGRSLALYMRLFPLVLFQDVPWPIKQIIRFRMRRTMMKGWDTFVDEYHRGFRHSFINYSEAMGLRADLIREWEEFLAPYDLLICPSGYGPAYERREIGTPFTEDDRDLSYIEYVWPYLACFNATGHPCMNLPLGLDENGLPVGVQAMGAYWSEPTLTRFAQLASGIKAGFVMPSEKFRGMTLGGFARELT